MRTIYPILAFIMIVLLSGCTFPGRTTTEDIEAFVGGDEGLVVDFVSSNPPPRVFQNRNFNVILSVENQGEYNVAADAVRVFFSNGQNFGLDTDEKMVRYNLEPIQKRVKSEVDFIPGGIEHIAFNDLAYSGPTMLTEDSPVSIAVDVCYPYSSVAVADVCITRDYAESDICDPIGSPVVQTSSGPLLVTELNQLFNGLEAVDSENALVQFKLSFEEVGEGDLYPIDTDCLELSYEKGMVGVSKITLGEVVFEGAALSEICDLGDDLKLGFNDDGEGILICTFSVPITHDFEDRFTITFDYKHTQLLNKQIAVMPVLQSMKKCAISEDCEDDKLYCEQPGFCRNMIKDNFPCGYPMLEKEVKLPALLDATCKSGACTAEDFDTEGICEPSALE